MIRENDIVCLNSGKHTDIEFKVTGQCIKFDEEEKCLSLFKIIEPLDRNKFIERFVNPEMKGIEETDFQIVIKPEQLVVISLDTE
ncbi:hypothetical protein I3271_05530 [Photobacterium leiognathi]|uniref:hypothetical protein n=1 Tax=Photobacterium leiognathi TaxID=553611 RepID=UPI001EDD0455|nr:hypothetical protein [Photobacterium leiognathi]MCG3884142.1 hypothetical protein [Photobacterium leiognathi]